jgi:hypothetical protein
MFHVLVCANHVSNYVLVRVSRVPNYVLVCVMFGTIFSKWRRGKKKQVEKKWVRPLEAPRRKHTHGQKRTFSRPPRDANGRAWTIYASEMRCPIGDALSLHQAINFRFVCYLGSSKLLHHTIIKAPLGYTLVQRPN